jgi:hypothetical protein
MSMDVGVGQLVEELQQRGDRLPFEIGAFVALEACEGLLQNAVKLEADDVRVTLEGSVVVAPSAEHAEPDEAARSLVSVLSRLLIAAGPGVPPHLLELVRESASGQVHRDLRNLHDAIEASLIPLNRGASRRVLARLVRESDRPSALEAAGIDPEELDAELDELLRDPATRTRGPEPGSVPLGAELEDDPITAKITMPTRSEATGRGSAGAPEEDSMAPPKTADGAHEASPPVRGRPAETTMSSTRSAAVAAVADPGPIEDAVTATIRVRFPEQEPRTGEVSSASSPFEEPEEQGSAVYEVPEKASAAAVESATSTTPQWAITTAEPQPDARVRESRAARSQRARPSLVPWLLVLGAALGGYALISSGVLEGFGSPTQSPAPAPSPISGTIEVTVDPPDSQVFLYVGRGPTLAQGLTVAGPHEFVVFDRGLEPTRAVVPRDAQWTATSTGPLYELAVQPRPADGSSEYLDLGLPLIELASEDGPRGTVRVITNPIGAKVYRLVGIGPEAEIRASSIHEGHEILVYHPDHSARRAVIGPSDWASAGQGADHTASLAVELPPISSSDAAEITKD